MICGAIVAALSLFFKADQIFVTGTSRYSQQQVLQASGIRQGGNLFLLNKHQAAAAITDQLPYVESVRIRRQLPNALRIEITECTHPLALEQDGALWLLNGNGKLIDKLQPGQGESCPLVTGLTLTSPQLGQLAVPENQDKWNLLHSSSAAFFSRRPDPEPSALRRYAYPQHVSGVRCRFRGLPRTYIRQEV